MGIIYVHTIGDYGTNERNLRIIGDFICTVDGKARIIQVENDPYKKMIHVNNFRAMFLEEQIFMS